MKIPACIISFNRALYLDSLLHSLQDELSDLDLVIVDNGSKEKKIEDVFSAWQDRVKIIRLQGGDWINDEYKAKNAFIEYCRSTTKTSSSESLLFLQDDMQYVGPRRQLKNIIEDLNNTGFLNISMTGVRKSTIASSYSSSRRGNVWQLKDNHFGTIGLHRRQVFEEVGPYSQSYPIQREYWGRGEDDYHARVISKYGQHSLISGFMHAPVFVSVWNDPRGHYSFLRDNKRYGTYTPPVAPSRLYYEHLSVDRYNSLVSSTSPAGYIDIAMPIGWQYARSLEGDQEKYPQQKILLEGPVSEIE